MRQLVKIWIVPTVLFAGCVAESETQTSTVNEALTADNGLSFNGISFNGKSVNGVSYNGKSFNGISLNGLSFNGKSFNGISFNGKSFNGISFNGRSFNGVDFIHAEMTATLSDGSPLELRIDDIAPLSGDNDDVLAYSISMRTDSGHEPLCGYELDGSVVQALAVPGTWNLVTGAWSDDGEHFSLACRHASVAKCVEFGYKSWLGRSDHHHACVRMLRADYCGDGVAHTVNGTPINLYDNLGVQLDTESWPVDAEWTPDGALCFDHHRGGAEPSCAAERQTAWCGSFENGALLIDEYNGQ